MGKQARSISKKSPENNKKGSESFVTQSKKEFLEKHSTKTSSSTSSKSPVLKWTLILASIFILLLISGVFSPTNEPGKNKFVDNENLPVNTFTGLNGEKLAVIVYSSPSCNCCAIYTDYLNDNGFDAFLKRLSNEEFQKKKDDNGIPQNQRSCHTAVLGDYFEEGHIPISVIYDLLSQNPSIDGIALPDMPLGTPGMGVDNPGMGGEKNEDWVVSSILNGQVVKVFAII